MEDLKYIIDDNTIVELLGLQSFTTKESAILELVKNAYDAGAKKIVIEITPDSIIITDDGNGMNEQEFKENWLHIGKSNKGYDFKDEDGNIRIAAGAKGVGRFALARLGSLVVMHSKKEKEKAIKWSTDWTNSNNKLDFDESVEEKGTIFDIQYLRDVWNRKQVVFLADFLSRTYNDDKMTISLYFNNELFPVNRCFMDLKIGQNFLSSITLHYDSKSFTLTTNIENDEFDNTAKKYLLHEQNIATATFKNNIFKEFEKLIEKEELREKLFELGNFSANFYFCMDSINPEDKDKFLYKHTTLSNRIKKGIILYRNAFSISSCEGYKDWLQIGKRSTASPASPSHPTGAWRVRTNQLSGQIYIDKEINKELKDLINRQGLIENDYYILFTKIIILGISNFERYRQSIIRDINLKNHEEKPVEERRITDEIINQSKKLNSLSKEDETKLLNELEFFKKNEKTFSEKEERYRYDIRILNVLATIGLKSSSIAHELNNDRNIISDNYTFIVNALKKYKMWDELNLPEKTKTEDVNVPGLLLSNKETSNKFLRFVDTLLTEIEKKQFIPSVLDVNETLEKIVRKWESQYSWIKISYTIDSQKEFFISEDVLNVIFDNLILNSIQQNSDSSSLTISIEINNNESKLLITYKDNGIGLPEVYQDNPYRILEPLESSREDGHGLGMWIINNTLDLTGGNVNKIYSGKGFKMQFTIGDKE